MVNIIRLQKVLRFGWVVFGCCNFCFQVLGCFGCILGFTELSVVFFIRFYVIVFGKMFQKEQSCVSLLQLVPDCFMSS